MEKTTRCNLDVLPSPSKIWSWSFPAPRSRKANGAHSLQTLEVSKNRPKDTRPADSWEMMTFPRKWGGRDFRKRERYSREADEEGTRNVLELVWGLHSGGLGKVSPCFLIGLWEWGTWRRRVSQNFQYTNIFPQWSLYLGLLPKSLCDEWIWLFQVLASRTEAQGNIQLEKRIIMGKYKRQFCDELYQRKGVHLWTVLGWDKLAYSQMSQMWMCLMGFYMVILLLTIPPSWLSSIP